MSEGGGTEVRLSSNATPGVAGTELVRNRIADSTTETQKIDVIQLLRHSRYKKVR